MPLGLEDIRALVESGDLQKFVGEFEGPHLDAKSQPYVFTDGDHAKRELAKDITAFANASGGCIIIGADTVRPALQEGEQISGLKPFPVTLFSTDQYEKIIEEWLYPRPGGLIVRWYPDPNIPTSGVGLIFVPAQDPVTKPYMITRTIVEKKSTETLFGYAERRLDRTYVKSVVELQHALRVGMNLEATLLSRITDLETLL
jgi:hypothetical protein